MAEVNHDEKLPWQRSIRLKLVVTALIIEAIMLSLLLANSYRLVSEALDSQTRMRLESLTPLLNASLAGLVFQRDHSEIEAILSQLSGGERSEFRYLTLYDMRGRLLAHSGSIARHEVGDIDSSVAEALDDLTYDTVTPLTLSGDTEVGRVAFGLSLQALLTLRGRVLTQSLIIAALEIFLSLLLLTSAGYLLTRHLAQLLAATRRVSAGNYSQPIEVPTQDEIGILADNFNAMTSMVRERVEALAESENRFRAIFDAAGDAIFILDADTGAVLDVNRRMCEMYGCSRQQALTLTLAEMSSNHPPYSLKEALAHIARVRTDGPQSFDWQARRLEGTLFWVEVNLRQMVLNRGEQIVALVRDITERKQIEEQLRQSASVFEHASEGISITDARGTIIDVNRAFSRITGYSRQEVLGQTHHILASGRHSHRFYQAMWCSLIEQGRWSGEIWNRRKSGDVYPELLTISAIYDDHGQISRYVALFSDISLLKQHQQQLEHIAHYDALTHLPNRVLLNDRMAQALAHSQRHQSRLAVVYLDLDGFKQINDNYGHAIGDRVLVELSQRMKSALREGDTLARIGGDEFIAVLLEVEPCDDCLPLLQRVLHAAAKPMQIEGSRLQISASLGVTYYPQNEEVDADLLLRQADQAMYIAKQQGKNRYHLFDAEHDRQMRGRHESIERIRQGLERQEFVLFYQPKVNMHSGEVIGFEALIRWQNPQRGLLPPAAFLPQIENHSLIIEVGEWVVESALSQMEQWQRQGIKLPVSVNIAGRHFLERDFVDKLELALTRHPDVAIQLELEVLESSALEDISLVSATIDACQALGVTFALDDFGTGYASLTYLKRLPAQLLKIDQSFVRDMLESVDDLAILEGIVGLAESFQRQLIAEGVETRAHGEMLLRLGCLLGQGYAISRPMPAAAVAQWLAQWQHDAACAQIRRVERHELPLLFAMVEHRAWISALERHLLEQQPSPPALEPHQCRFGKWVAAQGLAPYTDTDAATTAHIIKLHTAIHQRAIALLQQVSHQKGEGEVEQVQQLQQLQQQRDQLLAALEKLLR
ncbi:EAL domain-containing protein [Ectothiorhodospiraceae bacterium BW-2]|nr:EAL domain-containing protein [Ectothiorhodospiraceae bacterium BW-2]